MENEYVDQLPQKTSSLFDLLPSYTPDTRSLREIFVDEAVEKINLERKGTKYKPVTKREVAIRINMCCKSDTDIHYFQKICQKGASYSKVFYGASKIK